MRRRSPARSTFRAVAIQATMRSTKPETPAARSTSPAMSASSGTRRRTTTTTRHRTARTGGTVTAWSSAWPMTRTTPRETGSLCAKSSSRAPARPGHCWPITKAKAQTACVLVLQTRSRKIVGTAGQRGRATLAHLQPVCQPALVPCRTVATTETLMGVSLVRAFRCDHA